MISHAVRVGLALFVVLLSLSAGSSGAVAQALGIEVGMTRAGYGNALQRPAGIGGYLDLPVRERFAIRLAGSHQTEHRSIRRSPCTGLVLPGSNCSERPFDGDARMSVIAAGVAVQPIEPAAGFLPELYVLATGTSVDAVFTEQGGDGEVRPIAPDGFSVGWAAGGQVHYLITPLVGLSGRIGVHAPQLGACGQDAWFPFCEDRTLLEFAVGLRMNWSMLVR
ncbi:hypothetical protein CRI94_13380 [Longibacter salinarum]|uniref:Outer membrane protein beta-barrel domain-containing protein n=2 Tax=Longibacter salinarum TaxID=1850348 RepID=A0A2A8CV81_9BACT|nr:hypothetical protein CRI94_13380 [Longibacter salinarum]